MTEERVQKAIVNHKGGYNCAQSVMCAFSDLVGMDEETAYHVSEGMGGGIGGMKKTCGAVMAMFLIASLKYSSGKPGEKGSRPDTNAAIQALNDKFEAMNQTTVCYELKGAGKGAPLRSCAGCVEDAAKLLCELFG